MIGLIPPNAVDVERVILGICLTDQCGNETVYRIFKDNEQIFYDPRHLEIYRAIANLNAKRNPINLVTVIDQLKRTNSLELTGGDSYIIELTMGVSSSATVDYYCRIVYEKYIMRKVIQAADVMRERAFKPDSDVFEVLDFTVAETAKIQNYLSGQQPIKSLADVHKDFVNYVKAKTVPGVPIPFKKLQEENQGWQDSDLIIIAARPGMGKTAFALELGRHAAKHDYPVHFFSLEMANIQLHKRIVANELQVDATRIRKKRFTDDDLQKIFNCGDLENMPFYYDDSIFQWEEVKARARVVAAEKKTKMIIIDYLQLITTKRTMSTYDRVSFVSRELKMLAKELKIPVIALSQLSREVENRTGKRPLLSDLRESGAIEQDADIILFPFRPEYYKIMEWEDEIEGQATPTAGRALLITAKNRHCGESQLVVGWKPEYQKFHDLDQVFEEPQYVNTTAPMPLIDPNDAFADSPF